MEEEKTSSTKQLSKQTMKTKTQKKVWTPNTITKLVLTALIIL
jgi:hypothetical protein